MMLLIRLLLIIGMALYSFHAYGEIRVIKKGIQPIEEKQPKKSKTKKALESEPDKEQPCEKEIKLCEANNA